MKEILALSIEKTNCPITNSRDNLIKLQGNRERNKDFKDKESFGQLDKNV